MKCSVVDCIFPAEHVEFISINGAPRKKLPVCAMHKDAAIEDLAEQRNANKIDGYDRDNLGESPDY